MGVGREIEKKLKQRQMRLTDTWCNQPIRSRQVQILLLLRYPNP